MKREDLFPVSNSIATLPKTMNPDAGIAARMTRDGNVVKRRQPNSSRQGVVVDGAAARRGRACIVLADPTAMQHYLDEETGDLPDAMPERVMSLRSPHRQGASIVQRPAIGQCALDATLATANPGYMIRVPGLRVEDWSR